RAISNGVDINAAQAEGRARLQQRIEGRSQAGSSAGRQRLLLFSGLAAAAAAVILVFGVVALSLQSADSRGVFMVANPTSESVVVTVPLMVTSMPEPSLEVVAASTLPFDSGLMGTPTPLPSATPPVVGIIYTTVTDGTEMAAPISVTDIYSTATTLAGPLDPMTTTPIPLHAGPSATRDMSGDIVATSVLSMSPVPMTSAAINGLASTTAMPSATITATVTVTATPPGTATLAPTMQIAGTQVALLTTFEPFPATVTPAAAIQVIPLSAGEIDDNADWDTYLIYRRNYLLTPPAPVLDIDVTGHQFIRVTNAEGYPVLGAQVFVYAGQTLVSETRTMATGETLFFPHARAESSGYQSFRVVVQREQSQSAVEFTLEPLHGPLWNVALPDVTLDYNPINVDVVFLLDATGSMADEIAQLQNNILAISSQIDALPGNIDAHYGLVTYRDRGERDITQLYDLTSNLSDFQQTLNAVQAGGGGDYPESLNQALDETLDLIQWRGSDTIKLVFLVADAPPHLDYPNDTPYTQSLIAAARRGIKIHPIASSGLDQQGEFILRQIAQYTLGHFVFLTYEQGGSGPTGTTRSDLNVGIPDNPADPQDEGDYTVEQLDELVLRLITDEINALGQRYPVGTPVPLSTRPAVAINQSSFNPTPPLPTWTPSWTPPPLPTDVRTPIVQAALLNSTALSLRLNFGVVVLIVALLGLLAYALLSRWWYGRNFPPSSPGFKRKHGEKRKLGDLEVVIVEDE
ncbi:MAG: VWA domain-containing protein, partial [Burkholderiales bacterium]|nr:VWA domain-containing protein [Anaerolineae bacterium]